MKVELVWMEEVVLLAAARLASLGGSLKLLFSSLASSDSSCSI